VRLLDGPFKKAATLNSKVLLEYDADRLLAGYRKEAGLDEKAASYPNWDGLDGHVAGHYVSALALNTSSTVSPGSAERLLYMIAELKACAAANNAAGGWRTGYLGAVPGSAKIWPAFMTGNFKEFRSAWVPFYNIHKMMAGLRDAWLYTGNNDAQALFLGFCDWTIMITSQLSDTQMQEMLEVEQGGMNEVLADAFGMTADKKYLAAAKRFSHHLLLDAMAAGKDNLDNKHANTQVPKAIGFERIGELTDDRQYSDAGRFFWNTVVSNRTLAFGGNSRREFFPSAAASTDFITDVEGPETCNSYNMLKLTEDLFRMEPLAKYADYYERTLYNHILSTQHPLHGGYVYFTPVRPRHYRVYSAPNQAMWCCVGSGMENHSKYGQFIYTHTSDSLFVNLFIASTLDWANQKIGLKQETSFPESGQSKIIITEGSGSFTILVRYPAWIADGKMDIRINGKSFAHAGKPSSYIPVKRNWKKGDVLTFTLPMTTRIEHLPDQPSYIAFMRGPILLAARSAGDSLPGLVADGSRWGHIAHGERLPVESSPIILDDDLDNIADRLKSVNNSALTFEPSGIKMLNAVPVTLEPFYRIHDSRYIMYWLALDKNGYQSYIDSLGRIEQQRLQLEKQTVDVVAPGEQQPEADHFIKQENSNTGNQSNEFWRSAANGGFFSYQLSTGGLTDLSLVVRYWGAEWGNRKFELYIDEEKLLTIDNTGKWNQSAFRQEKYEIPASMLRGKEKIRIRFQSVPGNTAGAVYNLRLIKKQ
ncbi:MAG: hypothetical protein EOO09_07890, partial [Chitinophagaceae bacterium]